MQIGVRDLLSTASFVPVGVILCIGNPEPDHLVALAR